MKKLLDSSFIRFLIVGVINTLVGTAVMFGLYNLAGLHTWGQLGYWLSTIGNYTVGSVVSFFLNKHYTVKNKEKGADNMKSKQKTMGTVVLMLVIVFAVAI